MKTSRKKSEEQGKNRIIPELEEEKEFFSDFEIILLEDRYLRVPTMQIDYDENYIDCFVSKI